MLYLSKRYKKTIVNNNSHWIEANKSFNQQQGECKKKWNKQQPMKVILNNKAWFMQNNPTAVSFLM